MNVPNKKIIENIANDFLEILSKLRIKPKSIANTIIDNISPKDHNKLYSIKSPLIFYIINHFINLITKILA